jgi:hypothetical protein
MIDWPTQGFPVGDLAGWTTALAALVALVFGVWQVVSSRASGREATAKQIWMTYELEGLKNRKYANPDLSVLECNKKTFDDDRGMFYDYQWFVSFMLLACDEVLRLRTGAWDWEQVVNENIGYHKEHIASSAFDPSWMHISPRLRSKIIELGIRQH